MFACLFGVMFIWFWAAVTRLSSGLLLGCVDVLVVVGLLVVVCFDCAVCLVLVGLVVCEFSAVWFVGCLLRGCLDGAALICCYMSFRSCVCLWCVVAVLVGGLGWDAGCVAGLACRCVLNWMVWWVFCVFVVDAAGLAICFFWVGLLLLL